jgi:peptidoglycan/LPS O-acetylase OafA/YrhL/lysophospholipase L1-like esterase
MARPASAVSDGQNPPSPTTGNSTALDQWRGLALVFVLISHGFYFCGRVYGLGRVGVNLFFFISGVLVFKSLAGHGDKTGWERTAQFWKRRLRRLYPALVAYVLAMIPVVYALRHVPGAVSPSMGAYLRAAPLALCYGTNYSPEVMSLGHLWSLACEMQFYFLAPIIFLLGGKSFLQRNLVWGAVLLALVSWGFIGAIRYPDYKYHFEIAVWPMMLGFFCEHRKDWFKLIPARLFHGIILVSVAAFIAMAVLMFCGYEMKYGVIAIGTFVFIPCFLAYLGNRTLSGPIGRTLTWLGERTYSIYLWQQPLTICNYLPNVLHPPGAVVAAFIGGFWFRFFERPFLSQKRQQIAAAPKFAGTKSRLSRMAWGALPVVALLGVIAGFSVRHHYAATLAARVFPAKDSPPLNWSAVNSGPILMLGDSRIAMWNCAELDGRTVVNGGFPGITSAELAAGCGEVLRQTHPRVVVIQVGINDLKLIGVRPDLREAVISNCVSNVSIIAQQSEKTGARVIVTAIWPVGKVGLIRRLVWSSGVDSAVAETNLRLQNVLQAQTNTVFTDIFAELTRGPVDRQRLYSDTLHLNEAAYEQLTSLLLKKLPPAL